MYFLSAAPANFAGELGSSTRKTVQWTVFNGIMRESEGFPVWPKGPNCHGSNQNLRRGTVAAVLCGISSTISPECFPYYTISPIILSIIKPQKSDDYLNCTVTIHLSSKAGR